MDVIRLSGSYHDMGRQYGEHLARGGFTPPEASEEKLAFARDSEAAVRRHAPELLEELTGIACGGALPLDLLTACALTLGESPGCSLVIAGEHTADGFPLLGRNFDFFDWDLPHQELYLTRPTQPPGRWAMARQPAERSLRLAARRTDRVSLHSRSPADTRSPNGPLCQTADVTAAEQPGPEPARAAHRVTLIGKPGCHLCAVAREVVVRVTSDLGVALEELDISRDPALHERYWEQIPVTLIDGRQHDFWRVDERRLRDALAD